jgi:MFS family permease
MNNALHVGKDSWLTKVAVLVIFLVSIEVTLIGVALGDIARAFPGVDPFLINLVLTAPTFLQIPMTLLSGKLCYYFSKKDILLVSLAIYTIGGVGTIFFSSSIYQIITMRVFLGIGAGLAAPLSAAFIAELWDGKERADMMGYSNGVGSVVVIFMTMLAGALCVVNWRYTFFAYTAFILIFILEAIGLPRLPPEKTHQQAPDGSKSKARIGGSAFLFAFCNFAVIVLSMTIMMKTAIFVMDKGIGNAAISGIAFSFNGAAQIITGFAFGFVYKHLNRFTGPLSLALSAIAYIFIVNASSSVMVIAALFIMGLGSGMWVPFIMSRASTQCAETNKSMYLAIVLDAMFIGQALASFIDPVVKTIFGHVSIAFLFKFCAAGFVAYFIVSILWILIRPERAAATPSCKEA